MLNQIEFLKILGYSFLNSLNMTSGLHPKKWTLETAINAREVKYVKT